jgi:hypothetical protein
MRTGSRSGAFLIVDTPKMSNGGNPAAQDSASLRVHYGSNREASGRYAEAIVETAFPFLEELFQRITGNTVSLPHLLMAWIYREVEVARLVLRDLQNEQKPPEPYAITTLQHHVLWTYAAWPSPRDDLDTIKVSGETD